MSTDQRTDNEPSIPRAVLHKKILDTAQQRPDASMKELADGISGATTSIVQRVLRQYGDPGVEDEMDDQESEDTEAVATDEQTETDDSSSPDEPSAGSTSGTRSSSDTVSESSDASPNGVTFRADSADYSADSSETATRTSDRDRQPTLDLSELTEKQQETLRTIRERPAATQAALADELGVASATINQRVNSIDGFDWSERHAFVDALFPQDEATASESRDAASEDEPASPASETTDTLHDPSDMTDTQNDNKSGSIESTADSNSQQCEDISGQVDELSKQVEALERRVETEAPSTGFSDPQLAHKVVHACVTSDNISEEEELEILKTIIK